MGTLNEPRSGFVYLQEEVSSSFCKVLAATDYDSADTFLEHLIAIFEEVAAQTYALKVRDDVAQRFIALKCETRFQTSNDLMKHLLQLHREHQNKSPLETAKNDASNHSTAKERSHPRKRKSQPKRNVNHTWLDSNDVSNLPVQNGTGDSNRRERSVSSVEDLEISNTNDGGIVFDLSKVKQEVIEDTGVDANTAKNLAKDPGRENKPLCLALQKPLSVRDALDCAFIKNPTDNLLSSRHDADNSSVTEASLKGSRLAAHLNWRFKPEIVDHTDSKSKKTNDFLHLHHVHIPKPCNPSTSLEPAKPNLTTHEPAKPNLTTHKPTKPNLATQEPVKPGPTYQVIQDENSLDDDHNGYNYVLNSLDGSTGLENNHHGSCPEGVTQLSARYQKSTPYTLMSDENAEDLSLHNEKSHNAFMLKANEVKVEKQELSIKYDRNGNSIAYPIAKLPNGQFAQAQIAVPQNLIFHESKPVGSHQLVGEPQILQISQASKSVTVAQSAGTKMVSPSIPGNQSVMFFSGQPPQLQLFNIRGPPHSHANSQICVQTSMVPQDVKYSSIGPPPLLIPVSAASSSIMPTDKTTPLVSPKSEDDLMMSNYAYRKRRKRMQDTTVFRDPPEQSLPFNGPNKFRFYCDVCDTGFTRRYTFNRHKCKGRVEKHYCQLCDKAYLSKYKLKDHILVKHEGQTVSCPECGKRFSSRSSMEMHKKQQHEGQYSIFCKICGKGFNHTGHYYGHMNKHTNTKPFWCQQCGKRFYGSSYLHNHKQVCRGNNELNFSCSTCDRKFKCELYLKKHMKIHDSLPIIADPSVAKPTDADLTKAGVSVADELKADEDSMESDDMDEELIPERNQLVFPNGVEDFSDSSLNSGTLIINESKVLQENTVQKKVDPV